MHDTSKIGGHTGGATTSSGSESYGIQPAGFRLPSATRLGQVRLQVAELSRSLAFYRDLLGFRVQARAEDRATLGAHGDEAPLLELLEHPGARPVSPRGRLGLFHFAVLLPERGALGRLLARLIRAGVSPGMADHLVSEALYLSDPDGLGIELYADRSRSAWSHSERELLMDTRSLDVQDLLQAGGRASWEGMPAGTTIGHVHLHVGGLDEASAFYHDALGFDKVVWSYPGALFLSAGGYHHHLGVNTWASAAPRPEPDDARLLDWEIILPALADVETAAASLREKGYSATKTGGAWSASDPWGTVLRLRS